jgi:hypothetical protein
MTVKNNLGGRPWSPEDDALLDKLWNSDQLDTDQIAAQLGRTPAGIMGRTHRLGWPSPRLADHDWPPDKDALVAQLWTRDGLTLEEIAEHVGRTRSAVSGRITRMGLHGHKGQRVTPRVLVKAQPAPTPGLPPRPAPPPVGPGKVQSPNPRPWTEREAGQCAFPVKPNGADTWSCCNRTYGAPYCPGHQVVMRPRAGP